MLAARAPHEWRRALTNKTDHSIGNSRYNQLARLRSEFMLFTCVLFAALIVGLLVLITGYLLSVGFSSLHFSFFTKDPIPEGMPGAPGGMRNGVVGTSILIAIASMIGIPIGMLSGIYLSEYSAKSLLAAPIRFISDVLAGVPSIVVEIGRASGRERV